MIDNVLVIGKFRFSIYFGSPNSNLELNNFQDEKTTYLG
jgi:hypothetical protein